MSGQKLMIGLTTLKGWQREARTWLRWIVKQEQKLNKLFLTRKSDAFAPLYLFPVRHRLYTFYRTSLIQSNSKMNTSASSQPTARTRISSAPTSTDGDPSGVTAETIRLDRRITELTDRVNLINGRRRAESHMEATDE